MTDLDQQRVAAWIGDAFAILCVRISRSSLAETRLRRGFESILRELGTSPLRLIARRSPLPAARGSVTSADLRHILSALDAALTVFDRYAWVLTPTQHRARELVLAARCHAAEELAAAPQRLAARACSRREPATALAADTGALAATAPAANIDATPVGANTAHEVVTASSPSRADMGLERRVGTIVASDRADASFGQPNLAAASEAPDHDESLRPAKLRRKSATLATAAAVPSQAAAPSRTSRSHSRNAEAAPLPAIALSLA